MTTVHLHLLLNHLPIIIPVIGLVLLALAVWKHSDWGSLCWRPAP